MKNMRFWGSSDDIISYHDGQVEEECYISPLKISSEFGAVFVHVEYIYEGVWAVGLAPVGEDIEIPDWKVSYKLGGRGYTAEMTIEVPDDAVVSNLEANCDS